MENQPPTTNASAWLSRKPATPDVAESDAEIARLKERLSFYESFDTLIQENVSRAGELLRHAAATRENAEQQLVETRREMEQLRSGDRLEHRSLLSGLLDDVTAMQVQIERLARRVADALDDVESTLPAGNGGYLSAGSVAPVENAPPLPVEPTMDELLPPDPPGESEHGASAELPAFEAEADAVAAEVETAEVPVAELERDRPLTEIDSAAPAEPDDVAAPREAEPAISAEPEEQPDTTLVMDEVVQEPQGSDVAPAEPTVEDTQEFEPIGDGVISGESVPAEPEPSPTAPAEENTVEPEATVETASKLAVEPVDGTTTADDALVAAPPIEPVATPSPEPPSSKLPWISSDIRPFTVDGVAAPGARRPLAGTGELRQPQPQRPSVSTSTLVAPDGLATAVLVHGVPRATTALSLKRYLEGLSDVLSVEPREYAEGVLRLHVTGQRTLKLEDLQGWSDGGAIEPVYVREDLIEVRLPS